jgi:hypothetical protein
MIRNRSVLTDVVLPMSSTKISTRRSNGSHEPLDSKSTIGTATPFQARKGESRVPGSWCPQAGPAIEIPLNSDLPFETVYSEFQYAADLEGHRWLFSRHARDLSPDTWGARIIHPL